MTKKYTICVDLDGVIHSYTSPWVNEHTTPDPPVDGAIDWLVRMVQKFEVVIFSTRCRTWRGRRAIRNWLREHSGNAFYESMGMIGLEDITLTAIKPPALVYIDDRAIRFTGPGFFPSADEIHRAIPWNKPGGQPDLNLSGVALLARHREPRRIHDAVKEAVIYGLWAIKHREQFGGCLSFAEVSAIQNGAMAAYRGIDWDTSAALPPLEINLFKLEVDQLTATILHNLHERT